MIFASLGPLGGPLGALLGLLWGLLGRLGGILGHLGGFGGLPGPSWRPSWGFGTPWRAPGTCLGADRASKRGGDACKGTRTGEGGALRRLQKPCQTALGILPRLNAQARWRILGYPGQYWSHSGQRGRPCDTSVPPRAQGWGYGGMMGLCACLLALRANALHLLFLLRRIATRRWYCCFAASCASRCTPRGERASMWNSTRGSSGDVRMWGRASFGTPLLADRARMGSQRVCVCVCVYVCVCVRVCVCVCVCVGGGAHDTFGTPLTRIELPMAHGSFTYDLGRAVGVLEHVQFAWPFARFVPLWGVPPLAPGLTSARGPVPTSARPSRGWSASMSTFFSARISRRACR